MIGRYNRYKDGENFIKKQTIYKCLLIAFVGIVSTVAGLLASTFFVFTIKKQILDMIKVPIVLNSLKTDQKHLLLFLVFSLTIFLILSYVVFFKRTLDKSGSKLVELTPKIEVPAVAGQKQYGSARFYTETELAKEFDCVIISPGNADITKLIDLGSKEIEATKNGEVLDNAEIIDITTPFKSGIPISYTKEGKNERILTISGDVHTITFGSTRCGKTRTLVIQSVCLQALGGSDILCSDPKGELYLYTYLFLQSLGYKTYALDFKNPNRSIHYNFLQFIIIALEKNDLSKAIQCCWDFVDGLVQEATKGEPLWTNGEKALMAAGVMQVVYDNSILGLTLQYPNLSNEKITDLYNTKHKAYQNCTNLFNYISKMATQNPATKRLWLEDIIDVLPDNHPSKLIMSIAESAPSKMRGSFITSALTTLRLFTDPNIAGMTNSTDEDFLNSGSKKAIFMIVPDSKKTYYPLVSLFCTQYYQYIADEADELGGRLPRDIEFNLDEFGNFTKIPDFDVKMTVGAGRGIHFNLFLQSKEQLVEKYGKEVAAIILDNCHYSIYLKSGLDTCKWLEERLGKYTVQSFSSSASLNDSGGLTTSVNSGSSSTSSQLMARSLLTSDEIGRIERPYILVLCDSGLPSLTKSPDLHKWYFNRMLGLGDKDFNQAVRVKREHQRITHENVQINLWDFKSYINVLLTEKYDDAKQADEAAVLDALANAFLDGY